MNWKPMVRTASGGDTWNGNALVFATHKEAHDWANDLAGRWFAVTDTTAHVTDAPVTHRYTNHKLESVK
jgi:hypothetical protein